MQMSPRWRYFIVKMQAGTSIFRSDFPWFEFQIRAGELPGMSEEKVTRKKEPLSTTSIHNTLAREAPSGIGFAVVGTRKWVQANSYSFAVGAMTDFDRSNTI